MADGSAATAKEFRRARREPQQKVGESRISVVSFFAGCGGLDLGFLGGFRYLGREYPRTRYDVLAAYDSDSQAVQAYAQNIGTHAHVEDLSSVNVSELPQAQVLIGGFPCQEFSQCGPRNGLRSERGRLYETMVGYAKAHRPLLVVGENVAGLKYLGNGIALHKIQADFQKVGYRPVTWELRADEFGVPQARHRLFLIFVRDDLPKHLLQDLPSSEMRLTAKDAIADLLAPSRRKIPNQSQYFKAAKAGRGHGQGDERTPADGPAYTVRANSRSRVQFHYSRPRRLTVRECARLQTFPDEYNFPFPATTNMRLIGNAVPPILGYQVAQHLCRFLDQF